MYPMEPFTTRTQWYVQWSYAVLHCTLFTPAYLFNPAVRGFKNMAVWNPHCYRPTWYHIHAPNTWDLVIDNVYTHMSNSCTILVLWFARALRQAVSLTSYMTLPMKYWFVICSGAGSQGRDGGLHYIRNHGCKHKVSSVCKNIPQDFKYRLTIPLKL